MNFKNSMGVRYTKGLFFETSTDKDSPVYSLKDEDHRGLPSLYKLYITSTVEDPSEYSFAVNHLDGWSHWEILQEAPWFKDYLERWRRERDVILASNALKAILEHSKDATPTGFNAAKYILEKGWSRTPGDSKRGRPSKEEIRQKTQDMVDNASMVRSDLDRIRLIK